jgi:hypothetical protein
MLWLVPEIYVAQRDKAKCLEAQVFSDLVKEVLSKTTHEKGCLNNQKGIKNGDT